MRRFAPILIITKAVTLSRRVVVRIAYRYGEGSFDAICRFLMLLAVRLLTSKLLSVHWGIKRCWTHNVKNEIYLNFIKVILNHLKVSEMKIFIHSDDEEILKYAIAMMKMITNRCSNYKRAENSIKSKNWMKTTKDRNKEKNKGKIKKSELDRDEKKTRSYLCSSCLKAMFVTLCLKQYTPSLRLLLLQMRG